MAQTKTRASSKRSAGSKKPQARSRGSSKKSTNSRKQNSRKQASSRKRPNSSKAAPVAAMSNAAEKASTAVGDTAAKATSAVSTAAGRAKVPLIASGAALAGAAGGAALGARQARRHRRGLAKTARGMGALGVQVGHLASELQRNREGVNGGGQHRSPLEVVLEGLTARRSRA
jgi:hypothetical protein